MSKPALQKALTEVNTAAQMPSPQPMAGTKRVANSTAPAPSQMAVNRKIKPTSLTMPPIWGAEMDSCMRIRCCKPMRRREMVAIAMAMVTTPKPPTWISTSIMAWPKGV